MDEFHYEEEYQRNLRNAERTAPKEDLYDPLEEPPQKRQKRKSSWLLTVVQVTVCGALVVAALALKLFGGDLYATVRDWYTQNINNSIVAEEQVGQFKTKVLEFLPRASSAPESSEAESGGASGAGVP